MSTECTHSSDFLNGVHEPAIKQVFLVPEHEVVRHIDGHIIRLKCDDISKYRVHPKP